nr:hypothetical protein [Tanacetum cinerariifolium]
MWHKAGKMAVTAKLKATNLNYPQEPESTPPRDQQPTKAQKGSEPTNLPQSASRKKLFKDDPDAETSNIVEKTKHHT